MIHDTPNKYEKWLKELFYLNRIVCNPKQVAQAMCEIILYITLFIIW